MREMEVVGVRIEPPHNAPLLLLRELGLGGRHLPVWIGAAEASAIVSALEGTETERPLTHELLADILATFHHRVVELRITDLSEGTYTGVLVIDDREVDVRPSDGVAIAVRAGARILCDDAVLDAAGVVVPGDADAEVEAFRAFLDDLDVDDFRAAE